MNNNNNLGVAIPTCFFCGRDKNEIIMNNTLTPFHKRKVEEDHGKYIDFQPCSECAEYMKQGIILVSIRDGEKSKNPYRTGNYAVVKEEAIKNWIEDKDLAKRICQVRFCFIEDTTWDKIGLPKGEQNEQ